MGETGGDKKPSLNRVNKQKKERLCNAVNVRKCYFNCLDVSTLYLVAVFSISSIIKFVSL